MTVYLDYPMPASVDKKTVYDDGGPSLPGKGVVPADFCLVGIAPSTKRPEDRRLEPFGSRSHRIISGLTRMFPSMYITNLVKEPVQSSKKPRITQIRYWQERLLDELRIVKPKRILALGAEPARALCGEDFDSIRDDRGTFFWNEQLGAWVVPTYHFSAGGRNPALNRFINRDLERFFSLPDPDLSELGYDVCGDDWKRFLGQIRRDLREGTRVILDIETDGLEITSRLIQLGITWEGSRSRLFLDPRPEIVYALGEVLRERKCTIIGHNLQFDWSVILRWLNWKWPRLETEDTMLLGHIRGEEVLALKHLVTLYTNRPGSRAGGSPGDPLYLAEDVEGTKEVFEVFSKAREAPIYPVLQDLIPLVATIKVRGVYVDRDKLSKIRDETIEQREEWLEKLNRLAGASPNWNAPAQTSAVLVAAGVPLRHTTESGAISTAEKHLLPLKDKHEVVGALLKYRYYDKLLSGFLDGYLELSAHDSHLHPTLKLTGTDTGRLACADPNLQQVNREGPLKLAFTNPHGLYGLVDLSQAELRVAALLSGDEGLAEALLSDDTHRYIASIVFEKAPGLVTPAERKASKTVTFGVLYGGSAFGLAEKSGLKVELVLQILQMIHRQFPQLSKWMKDKIKEAIRDGYIETLFGRRRPVTAHLSRGDEGRVGRLAVNTPVQSVASDCMLVITRGVDRRVRRERLQSRVLFGVHDSLLLSVATGEEDRVARLVQESFGDIWSTPLGGVPLFGRLPLVGSFLVADSWASVESTNEAYNPIASWECSSQPGGFAPKVFLSKEEPEDYDLDDLEQSEGWEDVA